MAWFGASNQLIQIDTGKSRTYLFNAALSGIQVYANIGEQQVLGQRYFSVNNTTPSNPNGSPAIYQLVRYSPTSALTTANLTTAGAPAPVYWTDNTFSTVTGISTEAGFGLNSIAGYMMVNIVDLPNLTAAMLTSGTGAQILVQVGGYLNGAYAPTSGTAGIGNFIEPLAGTFTSQNVVAGTAPGYRTLGIQLTAIASGLCDVLVNTDII